MSTAYIIKSDQWFKGRHHNGRKGHLPDSLENVIPIPFNKVGAHNFQTHTFLPTYNHTPITLFREEHFVLSA